MNRSQLALAVVTTIVGCSHGKAQLASPAPPTAAVKTSTQPPPASVPVPVSPNLSAGEELARRCALRFNSTPQAPKFDFDQSELLPADRDVLDQVASCLTTGPLQGRTLQLVGRADPRGTEEYNLGLGVRRAESVQQYLRRLGVSPGQLSQTTRGELDASGTDEAGWREDRRVDLKLASR